MPDYKKELTKHNEEEDRFPISAKPLSHIPNESVVLFTYSQHCDKRYRLFYGVGIVYRVVKGEKCDLVYINFGLLKQRKPRLVVVFDNHARRQIMTLKRGQVAQVYCLARFYELKKSDNPSERKAIKFGLYAKGLQGWYVPKSFDIKQLENEDLVAPTEKEKNLMNEFEDVLAQFYTKGDDE